MLAGVAGEVLRVRGGQVSAADYILLLCNEKLIAVLLASPLLRAGVGLLTTARGCYRNLFIVCLFVVVDVVVGSTGAFVSCICVRDWLLHVGFVCIYLRISMSPLS